MRFVEPAWGLLFLPLIAGLVLSWRHVGGMAKGRKRVAFVLRGIVAGLLVLALMGPQSVRENVGLATVFVVDRSDSVSEADKKRSEEFVRDAMGGLGPDDVAGVVVFGNEPQIESTPGGKRPLTEIRATTEGSGSHLAAALRLAAATFPEGKARRIVVLSDGNETSGDAVEAAQVLATDGVQVDFLSLGGEQERAEASVLEMRAPSARSADEPFELRMVVESSVAQSGTIVLDRDGTVVSRVPVELQPGANSVVISQTLTEPGFFRYRASLEVDNDTDNRNNLGAAFVAVKGKPRVLLVQGDTSKRELARALAEQGIEAEIAGPGGALTRPEDFQPYDAVVFNDFNASFLSERQMGIVKAAVRDTGVGFMMVGRENSFLPGGWYGTPVADVLPVDLNVRQRKSFPSTTVLIVVDTSGSMSMIEDGVVKLDLAARAATRTAELLSANDRLGVAGSSDFIDMVAPVQKLTNKESVMAQIRRLAPGGGGIYAEPSVAYAKKLLEGDSSKVRHFILLADGADCDQHGASLALASAMRAQKITTTAVAIGDGKDVPFLKQLAVAGGGRFYLATKASQLPQIFTQDVAVMSRSAIEEGAFIPKTVAGEEVLRGIEAVPPLLAYCISEARPLARVGMLTQKDDPLLATWQFGLGTSMAFTSDAQNRWAREWVGWDGFGSFWSQAVRNLSRKATANDYSLEVEPSGGKGQVTLNAVDAGGNPLTSPDLTVRVSSPSGKATDVSLVQEAPGVFSGEFGADELGSYIVSVAEPGAEGETRVASSGFAIPYPPEYRQYRTNRPLLTRMAEVSGGQELTNAREALRPVVNRGSSVSDLWALFLLLAALVFPLDVAVRRIALPLTEMGAMVRGWFRRESAQEAVSAGAMGRLSSAKQRVRSAESAEKAAGPVVSTSRPVERGAKQGASVPKADDEGSAAGRLLAAKRKRRGED